MNPAKNYFEIKDGVWIKYNQKAILATIGDLAFGLTERWKHRVALKGNISLPSSEYGITLLDTMLKNKTIILNIIIILFITIDISGCTSSKKWRYLSSSHLEERAIYIVAHKWHTGIVVSADQLGELGFVKDHFKSSKFYEFGWGDEDFYQAEEATSLMAVKALFVPTDSVMHVIALPTSPPQYFPENRMAKVELSSKALGKLTKSLSNSFKKDQKGRALLIKREDKNSIMGKFFVGEGTYSMMNTCNTWTVGALDEAGVPIRTFFTLTVGSVLDQVEEALKRYPAKN